MKKYLFLNYYEDSNNLRKKELIYCFQKNLNLDFVDKVYTFVEKKSELKDLYKLKNSKKIYPIITNKNRITKKDIFNVAQKINHNFILIAITADIFLANTKNWKNIEKNFFQKGVKNKVIFCCRQSIKQNQISKRQKKLEKRSTHLGEYTDAFIFKKPFLKSFLNENLNIIWGSAGGDSLLMGITSKHYHSYYWGKKYKIYHFDVIRKKNENPQITFNGIEVTRTFEIGSMLRSSEHARIPLSQSWDKLLANKIKPKVIFLKKDKNEIIKSLRLIYYYIVLNFKKSLAKII